jgi:hypothetical protein
VVTKPGLNKRGTRKTEEVKMRFLRMTLGLKTRKAAKEALTIRKTLKIDNIREDLKSHQEN